MIQIGELFAGRYKVIAKLGEGGMGSVYEALDTELNVVCALKLLSPEMIRNAEHRSRFLREGKAMSQITHKNVARVFRLGIEPTPYMVLELVKGSSLRKILNETHTLARSLALETAIQVCDGMTATHERNISHRDLKPDNIMVTTEGEGTRPAVKIVDFGLARIDKVNADVSQRLTQTGALIGSVHYMSPEQCAGQRLDSRSDIYSLGCVLFECLTGVPPFDAETPIGILHKHQFDDVPAASPKEPSSEEAALNRVIAKALAKQPAERYLSMRNFSDDLNACRKGEIPQIAFQSTPAQKRLRLSPLLIAIAVGCISVIAMVPFFTAQKDKVLLNDLGLSLNTGDTSDLDATERLINQREYGKALSMLEKYDIGVSFKKGARAYLQKALCLQELGRPAEAIEAAKQSLISASKTLPVQKRFDPESAPSFEPVTGAVDLLLRNGVRVSFLIRDSRLSTLAEGKTTATLAGSLMHIYEGAFNQGNQSELRRKLLELEDLNLLAKRSYEDQAFYWSARANLASESLAERRQFYQLAAEAYKHSGKLNLANRSKAMAVLSLADKASLVKEGESVLQSFSSTETREESKPLLEAIVEAKLSLGDYVGTIQFCDKWLNNNQVHKSSQLSSALLNAKSIALTKTGRKSQCEKLLQDKLRQYRREKENTEQVIYGHALGQFYFDTGNAKQALETFDSIFEHTKPVRNDMFDTEVAQSLLCCAKLDKRADFDRIYALYKDQRPAVPSNALMSSIWLGDQFRRQNMGVVLSSEKALEGKGWDAFIYDTARTGCIKFAKAMTRPKENSNGVHATNLVLRIILADTKDAQQAIISTLKDTKLSCTACSEQVPSLLAICYLLSGETNEANKLVPAAVNRTSYGIDLPKIVTFLDYVRNGKVQEALKVTPEDSSVPTMTKCHAYEKLLMARAAAANNRSKDVPLYLKAARADMLTVLPAFHFAVEELDKQILAAEASIGKRR